MNINKYPEIKPGTKFIKKVYCFIMLLIVGRAIEAAAKTDKVVKKEVEGLPDNLCFYLGVLPSGPYMVVGKTKEGGMKYLGWSLIGKKINLRMNIRNIEAAIQVFTFQESTATAFAHDRFVVEGDLPTATAIVRILDIVEVYLLPKIVTSLAVQRYPKWSEMSPFRKWTGRFIIYARALGYGLVKDIITNIL
jgi:hypothetical protein